MLGCFLGFSSNFLIGKLYFISKALIQKKLIFIAQIQIKYKELKSAKIQYTLIKGSSIFFVEKSKDTTMKEYLL